MYGENTSVEVEAVATQIVDAAYKVHMHLGPGLLESVYETCLAYELMKRGLKVERQLVVPLDSGLRIDLLIEDCVIIEVKAVERNHELFQAQLMTYLKLTNKRLGILINFNIKLIKDGIKRVVL
jgi:GxxExxY protein